MTFKLSKKIRKIFIYFLNKKEEKTVNDIRILHICLIKKFPRICSERKVVVSSIGIENTEYGSKIFLRKISHYKLQLQVDRCNVKYPCLA